MMMHHFFMVNMKQFDCIWLLNRAKPRFFTILMLTANMIPLQVFKKSPSRDVFELTKHQTSGRGMAYHGI